MTAPLSRLTVLAQTSSLLVTSTATHGAGVGGAATFATGGIRLGMQQIIVQEGLGALWKGHASTCLHRFPYSAVNFCIVDVCWKKFPELSNMSFKLLPGALGRAVAVTACYPLEVVRPRHMTQRGKSDSIVAALWHLRRSGIGMYQGLGTALVATVPSHALCFSTYKYLSDRIARGPDGLKGAFTSSCLVGGVSGLVGTVTTFPLDMLRRRMQVKGMDHTLPQRTCMAEAIHVWRVEGMRGFYRGMTPELLKAFPSVAITFGLYECLR